MLNLTIELTLIDERFIIAKFVLNLEPKLLAEIQQLALKRNQSMNQVIRQLALEGILNGIRLQKPTRLKRNKYEQFSQAKRPA